MVLAAKLDSVAVLVSVDPIEPAAKHPKFAGEFIAQQFRFVVGYQFRFVVNGIQLPLGLA